jgi:hypothetical protein
MARVTHAAKARKDAGQCSRCRTPIKAGEPYKWFANRIGRSSHRKNFCKNCNPRPSEMTTSDKLSNLYAAQESIEDALQRGEQDFETFRDNVRAALEEAAQTARDTGQEYRDSKDNMPESFQNSSPGEELDEKADQCDAWADELESAAQEVESTEREEDVCVCKHEESEHIDGNCRKCREEDADIVCTAFDAEENESGLDDIEQLASDAAGALEL